MASRRDLIQAVRNRADLTVRESALCVDALTEWMVQTLASGKSIELRGIGSFTVKQVAARKVSFANAPKDVVPAHGRIVFRPSKALKGSVWGHKA